MQVIEHVERASFLCVGVTTQATRRQREMEKKINSMESWKFESARACVLCGIWAQNKLMDNLIFPFSSTSLVCAATRRSCRVILNHYHRTLLGHSRCASANARIHSTKCETKRRREIGKWHRINYFLKLYDMNECRLEPARDEEHCIGRAVDMDCAQCTHTHIHAAAITSVLMDFISHTTRSTSALSRKHKINKKKTFFFSLHADWQRARNDFLYLRTGIPRRR